MIALWRVGEFDPYGEKVSLISKFVLRHYSFLDTDYQRDSLSRKSLARIRTNLAINGVTEKHNDDWYLPGTVNSKVGLAMSPDRCALKTINS